MAPINSNLQSDIKLQVIEADGVLMNGQNSYKVVEVAPGQRLSVLVDPTGYAISQANPNTYKLMVTINPYEFRHVQARAKNNEIDTRCYQGPETYNDLRTTVPQHFVKIKLGEKIEYNPSIVAYDKTKVLLGSDNTIRLCFKEISGTCSGTYGIEYNFIDYDDFQLRPLNNQPYTLPAVTGPRFIMQTWENTTGDRRANLRIIHQGNQDWLTNSGHYMPFAPQDTPAMELVRQGKKTYEDFAAWNHEIIVPDGSGSYIVAIYSWTGTHPSKSQPFSYTPE